MHIHIRRFKTQCIPLRQFPGYQYRTQNPSRIPNPNTPLTIADTRKYLNDPLKAACADANKCTYDDASNIAGGSDSKLSPGPYHVDVVHINSRGYCKLWERDSFRNMMGCAGTKTDCASENWLESQSHHTTPPKHDIPRHTMPHPAHYATSHHGTPHYATPQHTTSHHTLLHTTSHYTTPHHMSPHHITPHHTAAHNIALLQHTTLPMQVRSTLLTRDNTLIPHDIAVSTEEPQYDGGDATLGVTLLVMVLATLIL